MIVEIIATLSNSFCTWSLIFYWNSRQASRRIEFDIISIKNIFIFIVNFYILISLDSLIVFTRNCSFFHLLDLRHLFFYQIFTLRHINEVFFFGFDRLWRRWGRLTENFNVVGWEEPFFIGFENVTVPPSVFIVLLNKYLITFLQREELGCLLLFLLFFIFLLFLRLSMRLLTLFEFYFLSFFCQLDQLTFLRLTSFSFCYSIILVDLLNLLFKIWNLLLLLVCLSLFQRFWLEIKKCFYNKHLLQNILFKSYSKKDDLDDIQNDAQIKLEHCIPRY